MIRDMLTERGLPLDEVVRVAGDPHPHEFLSGVKLPPQCRQQVHSGLRLALQEDGDVVARHFETGGVLERYGAGMVRTLLEHRRKSEELAACRFIDNDFL